MGSLSVPSQSHQTSDRGTTSGVPDCTVTNLHSNASHLYGLSSLKVDQSIGSYKQQF